MKRRSIALFGSAVLVLGCGGNVIASGGGSGGAGGSGGTGGTTMTTSVPPQCAVSTDEPAPYVVEFQFSAVGPATVYLRSDCSINYTITSCAGGYSAPVEIHADCTLECSSSMDCIACEPCAEGALPVTQDAWQADKWAGNTYTFGQTPSGCTCHNSAVAPAGKYRITVPVFATEEDALTNTNAILVAQDFDLPAPNGTVTIPVDVVGK